MLQIRRLLRPYLSAIGRHLRQKGFDLLLRAMAEIVKNPAFQHDLILAGVGTEHEQLPGLSGELGLTQRIVFLG